MNPEDSSCSCASHVHEALTHPRSRGRFDEFLWQFMLLGVIAIIVALLVNTIRTDGLPWIGNYSEQTLLVSPSGRQLAIPLSEAFRLHEQKNALFIDARNPAEYQEGHIQGAINVPLSQAEDRLLPALEGIPDSAIVITYCDGDHCNLSKELAIMIESFGFTNVKVLVNGWSVWKKAGYPIERSA
jgi:rhodanese-related sulfurtransferase